MLRKKRVALQSFVFAVHYSALRRVEWFFRVNVSSFLEAYIPLVSLVDRPGDLSLFVSLLLYLTSELHTFQSVCSWV